MTPNQSHGHVTPNANGLVARCGGPAICAHCQFELAQLRAKSTPAEVAQGEAVEVVAWMKHELCTRLYFHAPPDPSIPLMTVAQHNRIVAALTAPPSPDAELIRQCIADELAEWEGNYKFTASVALNSLQARIDAKLAGL